MRISLYRRKLGASKRRNWRTACLLLTSSSTPRKWHFWTICGMTCLASTNLAVARDRPESSRAASPGEKEAVMDDVCALTGAGGRMGVETATFTRAMNGRETIQAFVKFLTRRGSDVRMDER